jgi:hypothetical protein
LGERRRISDWALDTIYEKAIDKVGIVRDYNHHTREVELDFGMSKEIIKLLRRIGINRIMWIPIWLTEEGGE